MGPPFEPDRCPAHACVTLHTPQPQPPQCSQSTHAPCSLTLSLYICVFLWRKFEHSCAREMAMLTKRSINYSRGDLHGGGVGVIRKIQEYCLAGGSWSTVGPSASALQEGPKPYSCLPNQQRGSPSWKPSKRLLEGKPTVQLNRTLGFPE